VISEVQMSNQEGFQLTQLTEVTELPADVIKKSIGLGLKTAELFIGLYDSNPHGFALELNRTREEMDGLARIVEGYLNPDYLEQIRSTASERLPLGAELTPYEQSDRDIQEDYNKE